MLGEYKLNNIYNEDSYKVIKTLPDKSIDLIITDPPYGIGADKGFGEKGGLAKRRLYEGGWDNDTPPQEMFNEMLRVGKIVIIFGGNYFAHLLPQSTHWIVWDKVGTMDNGNYSDCELIWTNLERKSVKKVTHISKGFIHDGDERFHPTQKPLRLFSNLIKEYLPDGGVVADFFSGSGTTAVACKDLGYDFIAFELDKGFFDKSIQRLNGISQTGQTSIFTDFDNI